MFMGGERYELGSPAQRPLCNLPLGHSYSQSVTTVLDRPKHSQTPASGDRSNQSQTWPTAVPNFWLILVIKVFKTVPHTCCLLCIFSFFLFCTKVGKKTLFPLNISLIYWCDYDGLRRTNLLITLENRMYCIIAISKNVLHTAVHTLINALYHS